MMEFPELKPEARKWMFWLARVFGKRVSVRDSDCEVTLYFWRGKIWASERIFKERP